MGAFFRSPKLSFDDVTVVARLKPGRFFSPASAQSYHAAHFGTSHPAGDIQGLLFAIKFSFTPT